MPEILEDFDVLTALAFQELDIKNIQTDKCQEINKQLENFYSEQSTTVAATTVQSGKSPFSIDYLMVKKKIRMRFFVPFSNYKFYTTDFT